MSGNISLGLTIRYELCPGCNALHRITDCPDNNPPVEACICCEAIAAEAALYRGGR